MDFSRNYKIVTQYTKPSSIEQRGQISSYRTPENNTYQFPAVPISALQLWATTFTSHRGFLSHAGKQQPCQASSDSVMTLIFQACWWQLCEGWNVSNAGCTAIVLSPCSGVSLQTSSSCQLYVWGTHWSTPHWNPAEKKRHSRKQASLGNGQKVSQPTRINLPVTHA